MGTDDPARIRSIDEALAAEADVLARADALGPSHVAEIFRLTWCGLRADRDWCEDFRDRLNAPSSEGNGVERGGTARG